MKKYAHNYNTALKQWNK